MGKVLEHQKEFEAKAVELISKYNDISYISSTESKYLAIKKNDRVILTIYFRVPEIRIYIDKSNECLDLYNELLKDGKVYQHDTADENNAKDKFAFYVDEKNEIEVVKQFLDLN